ncbi:putative oligosaccharyl transferase subunit Dad1 [Aspergillus aculeatinus CBS 121060]|uniref:Defender against death DAD protein n=1 Tax=Aspergillus aculeatinus CBS 121060 TaxID=1448322 RepID=A0ACD1HIG1_9EURO|nr:defender against death DAD protein [Aspergillus aculeatinus CBS 121060]RAH73447.1 defender against death DAD protein [Aspergillus aculeatinus CBS 121060]
MPAKRTAAAAGPVPAPSPPTIPSSSTTTAAAAPASSSSSSLSSGPKTLTTNSSVLDIAHTVWQQYLATTPQRTLLLDAFMGFLVLVGGVQFLYCVLAGNYPFNAFLSGFSAAVGQFVLTASLRMQTSPSSAAAAAVLTPSGIRAFADYIFGSLILHFFCINFIN